MDQQLIGLHGEAGLSRLPFSMKRGYMKRIICIIAMLFTMALTLQISAFADEELYSYGHFYYHDHDGYVSIAGYLGTETEVEIPSTIIGKPVAEIESGAFNGCHTIIQITVPDTVVMVYEDSFTGADSLERIISDSPAVDYNPDTKPSTDAPAVTTTAVTAPVTSAENSKVTTKSTNTTKDTTTVKSQTEKPTENGKTTTNHADTSNDTVTTTVKPQAVQSSETIISTDNSGDPAITVPDSEDSIGFGHGEDSFDELDNPYTETSADTTNSNEKSETQVQPERKTANALPAIIIGVVAAVGIIAGVLILKRKEK